MKTKKWLIIGAVVVALLLFGMYNESKQKAAEKTEPKEAPKVLTYEEQFNQKHFNEIFGYYKPVQKYLKKNVNDPSSLEIEKTWLVNMNADSTFNTKTLYSAKNAFNATVKESFYCRIDMDGNLYDIKIE
jgi:hypothetical protein